MNKTTLTEKNLYATLRENAEKKYKRDGATCDKEKFIALYISACNHELNRRSNK